MLAIEHLSVSYIRRGEQVAAVRDVSFSIDDGESVGLVGESGSGKSTVALAILRLIRANEGRVTSGHISFEGRDLLALQKDAMRQIRGRRISMIFQDPFTSLNPVMRIREQLAEVMDAHGLRSGIDLRESLEQVHLDPARVLNSYPHQLSGGQRQRVMIAMALLGKPKVLLADEPTTALDVLVQKEILDLLFQLQKSLGMAMLFISHNLAIVAQRTDRLIVMSQGEIVEQGRTSQLVHTPSHSYVKRLWQAVPRLSTKMLG